MIKLQAAKCPQCGADIEVNPNLEKTICQYCGTTILIQEAVQKVKVEHTGTIKVEGIKNRDDYFKQAKKHIKVEEYEKALGLLNIIVNDDKFDIEAYCEMIRCYVGIIKRDKLDLNVSRYNRDEDAQRALDYVVATFNVNDRLIKIDENNEREKYLGDLQKDIDSFKKLDEEHEKTEERRKEILDTINHDMKDAYENECPYDFYRILNETMKVGTFKYTTRDPSYFSVLSFDGYLGGRGYPEDAKGAKDMDEIEERFASYKEKIAPILSKATTKHNRRVKIDETKRKSKLTIGIISLIFSVLAFIGLVGAHIEALREGIFTLILVIFFVDTWIGVGICYWVGFSWLMITDNKKR